MISILSSLQSEINTLISSVLDQSSPSSKQSCHEGFIGGVHVGWILDPLSSPDFSHQQLLVDF
ncbi:hypothetical protein PSHT_08359 [Puccinia striiformis]|uniref:Uncharacterized protein n=1 Tax=Puccinia striiformis TaxID=27350 RepID=A0A2S4VQ96_9BASI|nr:hypothetical protein PSHT_08359 [Puccinia striiformis]